MASGRKKTRWSAERRVRFEAKKNYRNAMLGKIPEKPEGGSYLVDDFDTQPAIRAAHHRAMEYDRMLESMTRPDLVNHPPHYNSHPSKIECIDVVEHLSFNVGNAMKYLWRAPHKFKGTSTSSELQDYEKAIWYIQREIQRLTKEKLS